jgi:asparagine synthase (glutamine-hydrolysing)
MCGFVCVFNNEGVEISDNLLEKATKRINHRGPDNNVVIRSKNNKFLAIHYRLAIVDKSERSLQPYYKDGEYLVYNGEIYNFRSLNNNGNATSDVIELFNYFSNNNTYDINDLSGMFAGVFYSEKSDSIYFFRDYAGQKPLFYIYTKIGLILSSEVSAIIELLNSLEIEIFLNHDNVLSYLMGGATHNYQTIINDVFEFPNNVMMSNSSDNMSLFHEKALITKKTSIINESKLINNDSSIKDYSSFVKIFEDSVEERTFSDYPIANLLSGGIDSLAISSALIKKKCNTTFFTLQSDINSEEVKVAVELTKKHGIRHQVVNYKPSTVNDIISSLSNLDLPNGDSSFLNVENLMKEVSKEFRVCISGDGGDELFLGYSQYQWFDYFSSFSSKFNDIKSLEFIYDKIQRFSRQQISSKFGSLLGHKFVSSEFYSRFKNDVLLSKYFDSNSLERVYASRSRVYSDYFNYLESDNLSKISYADYNTLMRELILFKVDRGSMLNSVELRSPLLDKKLARFAFSMPNNEKIKNGQSKYFLRRYIKENIDGIGLNLPKAGFGVNLNNLILKIKPHFVDFKDEMSILQLDISYVDKLYSQKFANNSKKIYAMFSLLVWLKYGVGQYISNNK